MNLLQISHEVVMNFTRIHESQSQISRTSQSFKTIKKNSQSHNQPLACPPLLLEAEEAPSRRLEAGEGPLAPPGGRGSPPCAAICSLEAGEGPLAPPSAPWWPAAASVPPTRRRRPGKKVPRTGSSAPLVVLRAGSRPSRRPCAWRPALAGTRAFHGRIEAESGEGREEGGRKELRGRGGDGRWWIRLVGRGSEEIKSGWTVGGG